MKIYNTMTRSLEEFVPLDGKTARIYTCGPTVYDYAHIGNFRAYIFEDILRRYLKFSGYDVVQVMNFTDVDDKTIRGAKTAGLPLDDYTQKYKDAFFDDIKHLNIERAEHYPEATKHIAEMIAIISTLIEKGYAYKSDDGSVYFSISKFADYGKLARLDMSGLKSGARVAQDEYDKENASDFALWKAWDEDDGEVSWESPWGRGRPGWHIECSAMSQKYLGDTFDIHTGGIDNIFPHHEDEIAQSEAATGKMFVKYWMHCAHLVVDGRKMSKSLGNFYTLRQIIERGYTGREIRYVLVAGHYRQTLNFTFTALDAARASLSRIDDFIRRLEGLTSNGAGADTLPGWALSAREAFRSAMDNDLNTSDALAALFQLIHDGNRALDLGQDTVSAGAVLALMNDFDKTFGFLSSEKPEESPEIRDLLDARLIARKNKNWTESDRLRDEIAKLGWEVRDTSLGQQLRKVQ